MKVNVSKTFLTYLSKNFFNLFEIYRIVMLYGTNIDTNFFWYFNITNCDAHNALLQIYDTVNMLGDLMNFKKILFKTHSVRNSVDIFPQRINTNPQFPQKKKKKKKFAQTPKIWLITIIRVLFYHFYKNPSGQIRVHGNACFGSKKAVRS